MSSADESDSEESDWQEFNLPYLYDELLDYSGHYVVGNVVDPWMAKATDELDHLRRFLAKPATSEALPEASSEDLWLLYALSRVSQLLILRFQPLGPGTDTYMGPNVTIPQYVEVMQGFGLSTRDPDRFHPFDCEIVTVEQADDPAQPPELTDILWPNVMAGPLLIERAGVAVSAGRDHLVKEIAERSTLHWAHRRKNRPYHDLSQGWGHNSQWRAEFRRDYRIGQDCFYNVDEPFDARTINASERKWMPDALTTEERIELVTHRCFVKTAKPHDDQCPYDLTLRSE